MSYCHRKFCACFAPSKLHRVVIDRSGNSLSLILSFDFRLIPARLVLASLVLALLELTLLFHSFADQALGLLVSTTCMRYRTSSVDLSTSSSLRGLTNLRCGNSFLKVGFTLRCLQRLSLPHFASLLCTWQYNSFTRGASIPVLSY